MHVCCTEEKSQKSVPRREKSTVLFLFVSIAIACFCAFLVAFPRGLRSALLVCGGVANAVGRRGRACGTFIRGPQRGYAAAAALNLKEPLDAAVPRVAQLPVKGRAPELGSATLANGVKVAAYETFGPVATIAIAAKAGSRYEAGDTIGAAQALKHFGFRSTAHRSNVRFAREIETVGGTLTTTVTRELVVFSAEVLRDRIPDAVDALVDVVRATRFTDYEVADVAQAVKSESFAVRAQALDTLRPCARLG